MAVVLKTLTLDFDGKPIHCQLDQAELTDSPSTTEITTFCDTTTESTPNYNLTLGGWQDYGSAEAVCDAIHAAYLDRVANPLDDTAGQLTFLLTVGSKTRSGVARPTQDIPFGGTAGSGGLKFTVTLDVVGTPVDGDVPPVVAKAPAKA